MSALYTQCSGMAKTTATRRGSRNSGVRASVQSWRGSCITDLTLDEQDNPILSIATSNDSRGYFGDQQYYGSIKTFNTLMALVNEFGHEETIKLLSKKVNKLKNI